MICYLPAGMHALVKTDAMKRRQGLHKLALSRTDSVSGIADVLGASQVLYAFPIARC
jgi:hypothetical protein